MKSSSDNTTALPGTVDTAQFSERAQQLAGVAQTDAMERLKDLLVGPPGQVNWRFSGEMTRLADGARQHWVSLSAQLKAHMPCARCREPAQIDCAIERRFLFADNERQAQAIDAEIDEYDVLVRSRHFPLGELLEDECLMALPGFVSHELCEPIQESDAQGAAQFSAASSPFAALAALRRKKSDDTNSH